MKKEYDFSKGTRGAIDPLPSGKTRITIRLDNEIIDWFRKQVEEKGEGNYQTMINNSLREYIANSGETLENIIRRVFRDEIPTLLHQFCLFLSPSETAVNIGTRADIAASIQTFDDTVDKLEGQFYFMSSTY